MKPNRLELQHDLNEIIQLARTLAVADHRYNVSDSSKEMAGKVQKLFDQLKEAEVNFIEKHAGPDTEHEQRELLRAQERPMKIDTDKLDLNEPGALCQLALDIGAALSKLEPDRLRKLECALRRQYREVAKNGRRQHTAEEMNRELIMAAVSEGLCKAIGDMIDAEI